MEHFKTVCMLMFDYKIIQVYGWCHVFKEDIFKELFARAVEEPMDSFQVVHPPTGEMTIADHKGG